MKMNGWKLIEVVDRTWIQDTSGLYTVVNRDAKGRIRIDVMDTRDNPVVTLCGSTAQAVYKGLADWLDSVKAELSAEHLLYIGKELARCEIMKNEYVQD